MADTIDDLDEIFASGLDDFQSFNLSPSELLIGNAEEKKEESNALPSGVHGLGGMGFPDLKSKKRGKQESNALPSGVHGLGGMGFPDLKSKIRRKQKVPKVSYVSEALNKLREQTRENVKKRLVSMAGAKLGGDDIDSDPMAAEMIKRIQGLAETQDMDSMKSIVESMMQHLLSKDILHEPMKEIGERYPKWLDDNKSSLSNDKYERYSHRHELIKELNDVYENNPGNLNKIDELMQKMQECCLPPNDVVQELSPDFDISNIVQLIGDGEEKKQESNALPSGVHGLGGMGFPDLKSKKGRKQKVPKDSYVSEALNKLREQTRETVKGLESMAGAKLGGHDIDRDLMVAEMIKQIHRLAEIQAVAETQEMGYDRTGVNKKGKRSQCTKEPAQ